MSRTNPLKFGSDLECCLDTKNPEISEKSLFFNIDQISKIHNITNLHDFVSLYFMYMVHQFPGVHRVSNSDLDPDLDPDLGPDSGSEFRVQFFLIFLAHFVDVDGSTL